MGVGSADFLFLESEWPYGCPTAEFWRDDLMTKHGLYWMENLHKDGGNDHRMDNGWRESLGLWPILIPVATTECIVSICQEIHSFHDVRTPYPDHASLSCEILIFALP